MSPAKQQLQQEAREREWDGQSPIGLADWGRDHWSTLAFIECKCVDGAKGVAKLTGGMLDHMKCNPRRHRGMLGTLSLTVGPAWDVKYSTELRDGSTVPGHDDWDCVNDMMYAGLIGFVGESFKPGQLFGGGTIRLKLTPHGMAIAGLLRTHKASGGTFATFLAAKPSAPATPKKRKSSSHRRASK